MMAVGLAIRVATLTWNANIIPAVEVTESGRTMYRRNVHDS